MRRLLIALLTLIAALCAVPTAGQAAQMVFGRKDLVVHTPASTTAHAPTPWIYVFGISDGPVSGDNSATRDDTITKWRAVSASATGTANLVVLDRIAAGRFKIIDSSPAETLHAGLNEFNANLTIPYGHYVGIRTTADLYTDTGLAHSWPQVGPGPMAPLDEFQANFTGSAPKVSVLANAETAPDPEPSPGTGTGAEVGTRAAVDQPLVMRASVSPDPGASGGGGEPAGTPSPVPVVSGEPISLTGANMNLAESVYFNNVPARTWWIDGFEKLTVVVPDDIPDGPVQVRVGGTAGVIADTPSTTVHVTHR